MAVKTNAIIEGTVVRITSRGGTTKEGKPWSRTSLLVVGDNTLADAALAQSLVGNIPPVGTIVRGVIEVGVYRDDDSVEIIEWLEVGGKAGAK